MRSYVAATTQTYRAAIDAAVSGRDFLLPKAQQRDLAQTFSRGFTPGFLEGVDHQRLVQGRFPKSRGNPLGNVIGYSKNGVQVQLDDCDVLDEFVKAGDGVVFDIGKPEDKEAGGRVWQVRKLQESGSKIQVELLFESGSIDFASIPVGCRVWKTDDPALRKRLEQSFAGDRPASAVPLRCGFRAGSANHCASVVTRC